jgi:hypothetical protein
MLSSSQKLGVAVNGGPLCPACLFPFCEMMCVYRVGSWLKEKDLVYRREAE